jgi:hypothetical protein
MMRADDRRPRGGPGRRRTGQGRQEQGRELELCAIEEDFATQWRAGRAPRLSDYCERFPEHTAALAGFVAALLAGAASDEAPSAVAGAPSAGTLHALDAIFEQAEAVPHTARDVSTVAEQPAGYGAGRGALLALARRRGITVEMLATAADLPVEVIEQLGAAGGMLGEPPASLVARLGAVLGVGPSHVAEALQWGDGAEDTGRIAKGGAPGVRMQTYRGLIGTHPALTHEQRARWLALLEP